LIGKSNHLGRGFFQATDILEKHRTYSIEILSEEFIGLVKKKGTDLFYQT
jgi:hypothetical protein